MRNLPQTMNQNTLMNSNKSNRHQAPPKVLTFLTLFTVPLDFGAGSFIGPARCLEIGMRTNGNLGPYVTLSPRQPLTPSPYAIFAGTSAGVAAGSIGPDSLSPSLLSSTFWRLGGNA